MHLRLLTNIKYTLGINQSFIKVIPTRSLHLMSLSSIHGFVNISTSRSSLCTNWKFIAPFWTLSLTKWYFISMCLEHEGKMGLKDWW